MKKKNNILLLTRNKSYMFRILQILKSKDFNYHIIFFEDIKKYKYKYEVDLLLIEDFKNLICNLKPFIQIFLDKNIPILKVISKFTPAYVEEISKTHLMDAILKSYNKYELIYRINQVIDLNKINNKNLKDTYLSLQYRQCVDKKDIVSKTNSKGIITYVNQNFLNITGYKKEELIGKKHSLLKSPKHCNDFYKNIWEQISIKKKPWIGQIYNINKKGNRYCVNTIIAPILDQNNEVIEYISIRNDVTDIDNALIYFKSQFEIKSNNFKEVYTLSKLYEKAIEESSIIIRVDSTTMLITYVNDAFCKFSGYTKEELINKEYSLIRYRDINQMKEMMTILNKGKIWKGKIKDIKKDGSLLHYFTTVVPMKNIKGEIFEYMGIRHDLTELTNVNQEIKDTERDILLKMGEIGESRSQETGNHVKRVAQYSKDLAILYGLDKNEVENLYMASPMHDIGKVAIPDNILNKPGKLTYEEFEIMKTHAEKGYEILQGSERNILKAAAIVAREHHEKWDGSGYPKGLKGQEIHIFGRITAITDVFDALGSNRVYKKAWKDEDIFNLLEKESGKHFDPYLVNLFLNNKEIFLRTRNQYVDECLVK